MCDAEGSSSDPDPVPDRTSRATPEPASDADRNARSNATTLRAGE